MSAAPGRAWLLANLPHQAGMNLLEAIAESDATRLRAVASGHRDRANPLRRAGELPIACAIEYAAQAAAAHGALLDARPSGAGMLVAVRSVTFAARRLDDLEGDLDVLVEQLGGGGAGVLYRFAISAGGRTLAQGRLTVAFAG